MDLVAAPKVRFPLVVGVFSYDCWDDCATMSLASHWRLNWKLVVRLMDWTCSPVNLSKVRLRTWEYSTPKLRWTPAHVIHKKTPINEHQETGAVPQSTQALFSGSLPRPTTAERFADSLMEKEGVGAMWWW